MNKYRIGTDVPFQLSVDDGVEFLNLSKCEILKAATYWSTYASQMVGV